MKTVVDDRKTLKNYVIPTGRIVYQILNTYGHGKNTKYHSVH